MRNNESARRVYTQEGLAPTMNTCGGGNREPKTICLNPKVDGKQPSQKDRAYDPRGISPATKTNEFYMEGIRMDELTIRKLTERECYRLMGFERKDSEACLAAGQRKSNLYHQAGDSIVVTCLMGLFGSLMGMTDDEIRERIQSHADRLAEETR